MARTSIQCPASGLVVEFTYNPVNGRVTVAPDYSDWEDMGATHGDDAWKATTAWIDAARLKVCGRRITVTEIERALGVELNELTH